MARMMFGSLRTGRLVSSLLLVSSLAGAGAATTTTGRIDLSYQPHLSSKQLSEALRSQWTTTPDQPVTVVDVSQSNLLDRGLEDILQTIWNRDSSSSDDTVRIMDLLAPRNGLTAGSITTLGTALATSSTPLPRIRKLHVGWNRIWDAATSEVTLRKCHEVLRHLIATSQFDSLCLACTGMGPSTCRAVAKGVSARYPEAHEWNATPHDRTATTPMALDLSHNDVGDAGAAALAAAIRRLVHCHHYSSTTDETVHGTNEERAPFLETLDLSHCNIGDVGANALALALEDAHGPPILRLLLSHNHITNQGALSLGRALLQMSHNARSNTTGSSRTNRMTVDLSGNPQITDRGISKLLEAVESGAIQELVLRSCSIYADGAELVGQTLYECCRGSSHVTIDVSGNPLGVLRGKSSSESSGYAASLIKSKATATASAYVTQGLSFLKKGLGQGLSGGSSAESDDEEEKKTGADAENGGPEGEKSDHKRCGFKALTNAFLGRGTPTGSHQRSSSTAQPTTIRLGLRRTFCDTAGADALAALMVAVRDDSPTVNLDLGLELNPLVEDEMIDALRGNNPELLSEMAERHGDAMEILKQAHERAAQVAARRQKQAAASYAHDDDWEEEDREDDDERDWDEDDNDFE